MNKLKIKVCGMTDPENLRAVCRCGPDYVGYIFYPPSPRYVGKDPKPELFEGVPAGILKTAVFVNEYYEKMLDITTRFSIGVIQLHGVESPETCRALRNHGKTVIKSIPGNQVENRQLIEEYEQAVDFLLFDTPFDGMGGSGRKFDWSVLTRLDTRTRFFLSGGIGPEDSRELQLLDLPGLYAADINSRFESAPGIKNPKLVDAFIKQMKYGA